MSLESWAVAAVAIVDVEGTPLLLRTYTSPQDVLNSSVAPLQAHLYVGPEDVIKLHFVLFASLDRCEEICAEAAVPSDTAAASPPLPTNSPAGAHAFSKLGLPGDATEISSGPPSTSNTANNSIAAASMGGAGPNPLRMISPTMDTRYLGKLLESHRMRSYGFRSVTGIRTLLVTVGGDAPSDAMVPLCRALYECASAALCNPFRSPAQSWRAQQQLLAREPATTAGPACRDGGGTVEMANAPSPAGGDGCEAEQRSSTMASRHPSHGVEDVRNAHFLPLSPGVVEWSWPRPAPSSVASLTAEPTLALSRTFNAQIEVLLSGFTVTARSCIIR